ncbi:bifunctional 3-(3-hydroxy-phenyl)propionate/3-hydroxycinnamic acid hydroxylase [Micromonospora sp. A3M-1-15]|uniref:bifunctional 3-(3-hydroxy-phenyl)propionate/3-hydroxycinnamic acid hydroxylase MhpA n=1 Tax=Micromonospora sp. A3M-1-15 TaxID=2962035 RepID=UPI0020B6A853|nr:bifunctional 3-(3-hydroxy-phenyl)propionate/3-hydroxycinnamic acid hydroxylase [Micromonospora sp. A3M-1-15]MCP3785039.1 bifunctional 3-(3-hydroxy-phenyl)propionate/3-hydroxycinnamic acid hydroxylase [Micromonospora sp. A3M-1-15]
MIVGAGPTGLTAATLLAQYGIECLILDRWESIYPQPRAVALDDEVHRILARLGLRDEFAAISRPHLGLRLLDRDMRVLAEFRRDVAQGRHGYPQGSMFDQPELEAILRRNLQRYATVTLRGSVEVTGLTQDAHGVRVDVTDTATGERDSIRAAYVLGCDGANSLTRASIGATMHDLGFTQRWLVIDVATEADLDQWEGVHQLSDPARAGTYMRIGKTRYRWEFQLIPGETADDYRDMARLHPLISRWTGDIPVADLEVIRVAEYTFRAQLADRWRDRRVFLLGDAAHLTPPFIGQGMCAGLRDAMNLAWKLAGVLDRILPEAVLDTYEIERKQHVRAMIKLAKFIGTAMTAGGELGSVIRRAVAPRLHLVPGLTDLATDSRTPPLHRSDLVVRPRLRRGLAGGLCPNAIVDGNRRLDDVAAGRFAIVTSLEPTAALRADIERRGAVLITARPGSELHRWLRAGAARAAVVRPDGTVLRADRRLLPRTIDAVPSVVRGSDSPARSGSLRGPLPAIVEAPPESRRERA